MIIFEKSPQASPAGIRYLWLSKLLSHCLLDSNGNCCAKCEIIKYTNQKTFEIMYINLSYSPFTTWAGFSVAAR